MTFVEVAKLKDLKPGSSKVVEAKGIPIAIFNVDGNIYATSNTCLHAAGSLGEGTLEDNIITCPLHGWQYNIMDGSCKTMNFMKLKIFKVKIDNDKIMVDV